MIFLLATVVTASHHGWTITPCQLYLLSCRQGIVYFLFANYKVEVFIIKVILFSSILVSAHSLQILM